MTTYTLTPAQCKALLLHIPKAEIRSYLIGAHVAPDGIVSATDGSRALRIRVTMDGAGADGIIPRELIERASKQKHSSFFTVADGHVTLTDGTRMPLVDGKFPDIARVCPMEKSDAIHAHSGDFNLNFQLDARTAHDYLTRGDRKSTLAPLALKWKSDKQASTACGFYHGEGFAMALMPVNL